MYTYTVDLIRNSNYSYLPVFSPPDAPKPPSVSVSPSAEIVEGTSVTLTCSSDANPAATYVWHKMNNQTPVSTDSQFSFKSIQPADSGEYYCTAENRLGTSTPTNISVDSVNPASMQHCRDVSTWTALQHPEPLGTQGRPHLPQGLCHQGVV
uniref:Ig-like domain-containing protein n=1 Tax=Neolamprologus brichardi TaxID=32507 RepID=A0A3Q4I541_NEOBR